VNGSTLSASELLRYSRQLALPELGAEGQAKLAQARVLIVGAGGLGSPAALYLAAAGVGTLGLVDFDRVDLPNLHRQLLYHEGDVGQLKVEVARGRLREVNPWVQVEAHPVALTSSNAMDLVPEYHLVIDGTDNFGTRYLVNDACVLTGIPNVYASVLRFAGQVAVLAHPDGPCYRCLYPAPPPPGTVPSCAEAGVLGVLPGLIGMLQAIEAIKLVVGTGNSLVGRLLLVDALSMRFREMRVPRNPSCVACGTRTLRQLIDYDAFCGASAATAVTASLTAPPGARSAGPEVDPLTLLQWRAERAVVVLDVREPWEWEVGHVAGAQLVPLGSLAAALDSLDPDSPTVVYCHHGARGQAAVALLVSRGFRNVWNLSGGIDRFSREIDHALPRY
jgi:adenylyltransferase/sulfurtransferase